MKRKLMILSVFFMLPLFVHGALGPEVSKTHDGKLLRWEEGSRDYFVMFKSLIENLVTTPCPPQSNEPLGCDPPNNPQADACIDYHTGSTFTLEPHHIPEDAFVEAAYLIWTTNVDPDNFHGPLDNSVTLSFNSRSGAVSHSKTVTSHINGTMTTPPSFEFEAAEITARGAPPNVGAFTYRVEVTDFMQEIIHLGREEGSAYDGYSLMGDYNVKNMTCNAHVDYVQTSLMVGDWVLFFIYTSEHIRPKKIYVYNGFEAYQHQSEDILVAGFELPDEAEMRLTMVVHEGDPGLFGANQGNPLAPAVPEALSISGASTFDWIMLSNICNPFTTSMTGVTYVEVFNSISSFYGWQDEVPYCIGGVPPNYDLNEMEYGIDVDTFFFSAMDPLFAPHLVPGDDHLWLKVGANQDLIYTNLLILSIDTKRPKFDIPPNPDTPDGREKNYCSCSPDDDAVCEDRPFYFTIKVENWGENIAHNVTVQDALPSNVVYIPGTTEKLVRKDWVTGEWEKIPDVNGEFPLTSPTQVADSMYYCNSVTFECQDSILIRFKVKPVEGIQKHDVIRNSATITDNTGIEYFSNSSVPLRLRMGNCPSITECPEPSKEQCGGLGGNGGECTKDGDCDNGTCVDGQCVSSGSHDLTSDAVITFEEGINSPKSEGASIIIANPSENLVVGQFTLLATGDKEKSFEFLGTNITVTRNDNSTTLNNFRIVHDKEGTGSVSKGDKTIATAGNMTGDGANLNVINESDRIFSAGTLHSFLIVLDAEYSGETVTNVRFNVEINGPEAILVRDAGKVTVKGDKITFAEFRFEPSNGFIVTKGLNDPEVPPIENMEGVVPVLQVRTKSMQGGDTIDSITVRTLGQSVKFGSGIRKAYLYLDKDNDGTISSGDEKIGEISSFDGDRIDFENLNISYSEGEEKHFLVALDLRLKIGEMAQIQIPRAGGLRLDRNSTDEIAELPVTSKEFRYECREGDQDCLNFLDDDGCSCSIITSPDVNGRSMLNILTILLVLLLSFNLNKIIGKKPENTVL